MRCERSFKRILLTHWGMEQLRLGKSYEQVQQEMSRLKRLTIAELKEFRAKQKEIAHG
jgi:hypothetical protein